MPCKTHHLILIPCLAFRADPGPRHWPRCARRTPKRCAGSAAERHPLMLDQWEEALMIQARGGHPLRTTLECPNHFFWLWNEKIRMRQRKHKGKEGQRSGPQTPVHKAGLQEIVHQTKRDVRAIRRSIHRDANKTRNFEQNLRIYG